MSCYFIARIRKKTVYDLLCLMYCCCAHSSVPTLLKETCTILFLELLIIKFRWPHDQTETDCWHFFPGNFHSTGFCSQTFRLNGCHLGNLSVLGFSSNFPKKCPEVHVHFHLTSLTKQKQETWPRKSSPHIKPDWTIGEGSTENGYGFREWSTKDPCCLGVWKTFSKYLKHTRLTDESSLKLF